MDTGDLEKAKGEEKSGAPGWSVKPFERHEEESERLRDLVDVTMSGISKLRAMPRQVEVLIKFGNDEDRKDGEKRLERAKRLAALAQKEVDGGFALVFSQAVISLWSLLEGCIQDFVAEWLKNEPSAIQVEVMRKLRVRVGEYERLNKDEKFYYLVSLLEQEVAAGIRNGIDRFESILEPFGFSGPVPAKLRRDIFEFGQVRNLLVHRGGRCDRQFIEACPWLGVKLGSPIVVDGESLSRYGFAGHCYAMEIVCRIAERFGKDMKSSRAGIWKDYGEEYTGPSPRVGI